MPNREKAPKASDTRDSTGNTHKSQAYVDFVAFQPYVVLAAEDFEDFSRELAVYGSQVVV